MNIIDLVKSTYYLKSIKKKLSTNFARHTSRTPRTVLKNLSNKELLYLFLNFNKLDDEFKEFIPGLPPDKMQRNWTGAAGKATLLEALRFFQLISDYAVKYGERINETTNILDFGCGWGRITRYFMRDVSHNNLHGADCFKEALDVAKTQNKWVSFHLTTPMPPTDYNSSMFDIIYLFSVFSHLSEDIHLKFLEEFHRILKPGGLLVATTRPRQFMLLLRKLEEKRQISGQEEGVTTSFANTKHYLELYDRGDFCHSPSGGGGPLEPSFYGESCIPEKYVRLHWSKWFYLQEYRLADRLCNQNVICCRKK
jgi:2-polyprenyl-3-methyl-5-hydroxy-6-metoxy-1,4-benzoquinol methylase